MNEFNEAKQMLKNEIGKDVGDYSIKNVTFGEYLNLISGRDEQGISNATVSMAIINFLGDIDNQEEINDEFNYETEYEYSTNKAAVNIRILPNGYFMCDLEFISGFDPEIRLLTNRLNLYGDEYTKTAKGETDYIPIATIDIMGIKFVGDSYISMKNPIFWATVPSIVGDTNYNILRMVFTKEDVEIVEINRDELDGLIDDVAYNDRFNAMEE